MAIVKGKDAFDKAPTVSGNEVMVKETSNLNDLGDVSGTPSTDDVLTYTGTGWEPQSGGGGGLGGGTFHFYADQVDFPTGTDWNVNVGAPAAVDSNNAALKVRRFDDTTDEAIGFMVKVPASATNLTVRTKARAETAPGGAQNAIMVLHKRLINDNVAVGSWSTNSLTTVALPTNEYFQYDETANTIATWGLTAGKTYQMQLSRDANNASDTLTGDLALLVVELEFS